MHADSCTIGSLDGLVDHEGVSVGQSLSGVHGLQHQAVDARTELGLELVDNVGEV